MNAPTRILGLDPGLANLGWGVIEECGKSWVHRAHGVVHTRFVPTRLFSEDLAARTRELAAALETLAARFAPHAVAMEAFLFHHSKVASGHQLANVTGMVRELFRQRGITVTEHSPMTVKHTVTGSRHAAKLTVQQAVQRTLKLDYLPSPNHAADALAVALTRAAALPLERAIARGLVVQR